MLAEPPQNGEYMVAAYVITAGILLGYWVALWRRASKRVSGSIGRIASGAKRSRNDFRP